ncbi:MAG: T9SS type A sorting domain-containing protein [Bacteroidia bacterium]
MWSQGSALDDSTAQNPYAYKSRIGAPFFIVTVTDPITGCFSFDTVEVATSLPFQNSFMNSNCVSNTKIELNWLMIPDPNIKFFGVDYSLDDGRNWVNSARVEASNLDIQVPISYKVYIERPKDNTAIYRWYAIDPLNEKQHVVALDEINCIDLDNYSFHPNPFNDNIQVVIDPVNGSRKLYDIQIMNQYGQVVSSKSIELDQSFQETAVNMDGLGILNNGVYYITIRNNDKLLYKSMLVKSE